MKNFYSKKFVHEPIEQGSVVEKVQIQSAPTFKFPRAQRIDLDNGMVVLYHQTDHAKKIDLISGYKGI